MKEPIKEEEIILKWTTAIEALDIITIKKLFDVQPSLLWTPLKTTSHYESDFRHFIQRLKDFELLGTSIEPFYALHYLLFDYDLPGDEWSVERAEVINFILKNTKGNELDTCVWGAEQNTVMHLALLLNQSDLTQQLLDNNASTDIPNKLGQLPIKNHNSKSDEKQMKIPTSDKFKRLRDMAESSSNTQSNTIESQSSTRRYFRPGHLKERKRREEEEAEKLKSSSQKDIQLLEQRSAVKNNPLFKKLEEQNQPVISAAVTLRDRKKYLNSTDQIKRSSRVINSLKENSYVSSSIFRQQASQQKTFSPISKEIPYHKEEIGTLDAEKIPQDTALEVCVTQENATTKSDEMTFEQINQNKKQSIDSPLLQTENSATTDEHTKASLSLTITDKREDANSSLSRELHTIESSLPLKLNSATETDIETSPILQTTCQHVQEAESPMMAPTDEKVIESLSITNGFHDEIISVNAEEEEINELMSDAIQSHMTVPPALPPKNRSRPSSKRISRKTVNAEVSQPLQSIQESSISSTITLQESQGTVGISENRTEPNETMNDDPLNEADIEHDEKYTIIEKQPDEDEISMEELDIPDNETPLWNQKPANDLHSKGPSLYQEKNKSSYHQDKSLPKEYMNEESHCSEKMTHVTLHHTLPDSNPTADFEAIETSDCSFIDNNTKNESIVSEKRSSVDTFESDYQEIEAVSLPDEQTMPAAASTDVPSDKETVVYHQSFDADGSSESFPDLDIHRDKETTECSSTWMYEHASSGTEKQPPSSEPVLTLFDSNDRIQQQEHQHTRTNIPPLTVQMFPIDEESEEESTTPTLANPHTLERQSHPGAAETTGRESLISVSQSEASQNEEWYDPDDWHSQSRHDSYRQSDSSAMSIGSSNSSLKNSNSTENTQLEDDYDVFKHEPIVLEHSRSAENDDEYEEVAIYNQAGLIEKQTRSNQEEGEIVVYIDPSISIPSSSSHGAERRESISPQYLKVYKCKEDDDTHSLIRVPSQTNTVCVLEHEIEDIPHDPHNPRIEDISHYLKGLPRTSEPTEEEDGGMVKRIASSAEVQPQVSDNGLFKNIPKAHEISHAFNTNKSFDLAYFEESTSTTSTRYGKMYIGVSGAHHVLLPIPKEPTYVRCIISDGEFEYMSRYEVLSHQIVMDYECIIDTRPGMIITVSLHVRPDQHVRPKTGWSKWFTSIRKQKESLSGYVYPEDGAIGQTRLAVDHMIPGCYKKTYQSYFDCFNSWYARTNQERARREKFGDEEDFLKIVGKLNVSMLYLPVSSPSVQVPKSLQECDLTLKICQWHETCWQSGYLSTRQQGTKFWERHYYRLIGSQLIGYTSEENANACQVYNHFNISDVIRLSVAADKVIVTLVEEDTSRIFTESIHPENNEKGFFRLSFKDYHVDCVCDTLDESEEWVKTLKSMIGHVQRFHYILDGIKNVF